MTAPSDDTTDTPAEPDIIMVGLEGKSYYLVKGDDYLNQILLVDGVFPKPVLCLNFDNLFDAKRVLGDLFSPGSSWGVHPEIIDRLRAENSLIETNP